jgi:NitT/TauT family transport system substrate-binding protein
VSLLLANSNGLPLKIVCNGVAPTGVPGNDYGAVVVKKDSPIKTAADLAGHTVATVTWKKLAQVPLSNSGYESALPSHEID